MVAVPPSMCHAPPSDSFFGYLIGGARGYVLESWHLIGFLKNVWLGKVCAPYSIFGVRRQSWYIVRHSKGGKNLELKQRDGKKAGDIAMAP